VLAPQVSVERLSCLHDICCHALAQHITGDLGLATSLLFKLQRQVTNPEKSSVVVVYDGSIVVA